MIDEEREQRGLKEEDGAKSDIEERHSQRLSREGKGR